MFRLLGFLIGSATAIIIILLVLGIPEFNLSDAGDDHQRFDAAVEKLREKQQEVADVAKSMIDEVTAVDDGQNNFEPVTEKALPESSAQPLPDVPDFADYYPAIQDELQR